MTFLYQADLLRWHMALFLGHTFLISLQRKHARNLRAHSEMKGQASRHLPHACLCPLQLAWLPLAGQKGDV